MASGQQSKSGRRVRKKINRPVRMPLAAHPAFAPLLGGWGMLLGAGVVLVLPAALVGQLLHRTLLGTWGSDGQTMLAAMMAFLFGVPLFAVGALRHASARRRFRGASLIRMAGRQVTPINPARDLGSMRLDDPVDTMPFSTPAWRDADVDDPSPAAAVPQPTCEPRPEPEPRELDLSQFAELPGRNAVWEEAVAAPEPAPAPAPAPAAPQPEPSARRMRTTVPLPEAPGAAALARLRAVPASELSLAEMVERFAGALHEVREMSPGRSLAPVDLAAREAALAEALKALEALSGKGRPAPRLPRREEPLRAARDRFQPHFERVRGAA